MNVFAVFFLLSEERERGHRSHRMKLFSFNG